MSPIPSGSTVLAPSLTPSVADSSGQPVPPQPHYVIGTGGLLFAVVAIVSVGGYLFHRRAAAKSSRTSNPRASGLGGLFSSLRPRGSRKSTGGHVTGDQSTDLEAGPDHVNMVYARFFHPTTWNMVECHPGTSVAPAIFVEDEAEATPAPQPQPFSMSSFLHMDDDGGDSGDNGAKPACDQAIPGGRPRAKRRPPYDFSTSSNVAFTSDVIGTTARASSFLSIPGALGDDSTSDDPPEGISSCSDAESCSATDDAIVVIPPGSSCSLTPYGESSEVEPSCYCSAYAGILVTEPWSCCAFKQSREWSPSSDPELGVAYDAYDTDVPISDCHMDDIMPHNACSGFRTSVDVDRGTNGIAVRHLHTISEELEEDLSDSSSFGSDFSPYTGIETLPMKSHQVEQHRSEIAGATDRRRPLSPIEEDSSQGSWSTSDSNFFSSPDDTTWSEAPSLPSTVRRYGMADMSHFVENLKNTVPEDRDDLLPVISALLRHFSHLVEADQITPCTSLDSVDRMDKPPSSSCDSAPDVYGADDDLSDVATSAVHDAQNIMQCILEDLHDFELECSVQPLSEDCDDSDDEDETSIPGLVHPYGFGSTTRDSVNLTGFIEIDRATSCRPLNLVKRVEKRTSSTYDVKADHEGSHKDSSGPTTSNVIHEGQDIMRDLLEELREFESECGARSLPEDNSESDYSDDEDIPPLVLTTDTFHTRRDSLGSDSLTPTLDSDVSDEGSICPITPTVGSARSLVAEANVHGVHGPSLATTLPTEGQLASLKSPESPLSLPCKAHVRDHRDSRSLWYGPRHPLAALPRL